MKKFLLMFLLLGLVTRSWAQAPIADSATLYTPEQLDELLAPIALYPDPLIAIILPASAAPTDIVLASQFLSAGGDPNAVNNQTWDDSVKALAHYPDVVNWMATNLDWTGSLGRAYVQQPAQVMQSIQQLRAQAVAAGTLVSSPQQTVEWDGNIIRIIPATPDTIYVPQYDPGVVFVDEPVVYTSPIIFYGPPLLVGPWLYFECDWDDFGIWIGTWQPGWAYRRDWRGARANAAGGGRFWRPDPVRQREVINNTRRPIVSLPQARPMAGAPRVENRASQGFHPAAAGSSRTDVTGWPPRGQPATPNRGFSATPTQPSPATPRQPEPATPRQPEPATPRQPEPATPRQPAPATPQQVPTISAPRPAVSAPPVVAHPSTPAPGPAFGGYSRGTEAADFSNRGQSSREAAGFSPPPAAPVMRSEPAPQPVPRSEPAPSGPEPGGDLRKRN